MFFASDNGAPVVPEVMAALMRANDGPMMPYGDDPVTGAAVAAIRELFEAPRAEVRLVATGTAANALSLAVLTPPWGAVFCQAGAHIQHDECGAPEFYTAGAKIVPVAGPGGRLTPEGLGAAIAGFGDGSVHSVQPAATSLTNVTEAGTVYQAQEIAALADVARAAGLGVHLDGARLANALAATGARPAEMTWRAGVDIVSFGGTKNGLMAAEAVILFDPAHARAFDLRRKRGGHLWSKHRFLAAQIAGWLEEGRWLAHAAHANAMAARLGAGIAGVAGARLVDPVEANIVFADLPAEAHARACAGGAQFYTMTAPAAGKPARVRLVTSWATTPQEVDALVALLSR